GGLVLFRRMGLWSTSSPTETGPRMSCGGKSRELMWCPRPLPAQAARAAPSLATGPPTSSCNAPPLAGGLGRTRSSAAASLLALIGDKFQQRTLGITAIDACACPFGAEALDRPGVDRDMAALKVGDGVRNRPVPLEAQIAVARLDRKPRHLGRVKARPMQIELHGAEPVGPAPRTPNELGAEHIAVERIRALPIRDMDHAGVERYG